MDATRQSRRDAPTFPPAWVACGDEGRRGGSRSPAAPPSMSPMRQYGTIRTSRVNVRRLSPEVRTMQTFLPYPHCRGSVQCLDDKRLGKQRVEAKQILIALGCDVGEHKGNMASRWRNHPAVAMWRGHERFLSMYAMTACIEWRERGFRDSLLLQFGVLFRSFAASCGSAVTAPEWWGHPDLHASHRSNLLRKDARHYGQFGWAEPDDLPYLWPTHGKAVLS